MSLFFSFDSNLQSIIDKKTDKNHVYSDISSLNCNRFTPKFNEMAHKKKTSVTEQWTQEETIAYIKHSAEKKLIEIHKQEEGKTRVLVPHPTQPRCFIEKWI